MPEQAGLEDIMNGVTILGFLLIILGILGLVVGGVSYTKDKDTVDLGPVDITTKEKEHVHIPPALAIVALIGGAFLVVAGSRRRSV
jgi:uncharacterized membrane protein YidH (DUF202 family)